MKKLLVVLLLSSAAIADTHTSVASGNASVAGVWDVNAAPESNDHLVILDDHTITWDIDSSGWAGGLAGAEIYGDTNGDGTPGMLTFKTTGTTNYLKVQSGNQIWGYTANGIRGRFLINSNGTWSNDDPYPQAAVATMTGIGGSATYINGLDLDVKILCQEPTYRYITTTQLESVGSTVIEVDTDVTVDPLWFDGASVIICGNNTAWNTESKVIAAGGITAGAITLTAALSVEKPIGSKVVLSTRNVRIPSTFTSSSYVFYNLTGGTVKAAISGLGTNGYSFSYCSNVTVGGTHTLTRGMMTTCMRMRGDNAVCCKHGSWGYYLTYGTTGTWHILGEARGFNLCQVVNADLYMFNISYPFQNTSDIRGTINVNGATAVFDTCEAISLCNSTFTNTSEDATKSVGYFDNCLFSGTVNEIVASPYMSAWAEVVSSNHDQVAGAFKSFNRGGTVVDASASPPTGYTTYYTHTCTDATKWNFRQELYEMRPGEKIIVTGKMRISHDMSAAAPKMEIIDCASDPLVVSTNVPLATVTIPVSDGSETGWQTVQLNYTNTSALSKKIYKRMSVKHADNTLDEVMTQHVAAASPMNRSVLR